MSKVGKTKLKDVLPDLESQYHSSNEIKFEDLYLKSSKKVLWICDKNPEHSWSSRVAHMANNATSCLTCRELEDRLIDKFPELAKEYSSKNEIPVEKIKFVSCKKALWVCNRGHEWLKVVSKRVKERAEKTYCPECIKEENNFLKKRPELLKHFSSKNNIDLKSPDIAAHRKYFWECEEGHIFKSPADRFLKNNRGFYCLPCSKIETLLKNTREDLREHYSHKNNLSFDAITASSGRKVIWVCKNGHEKLAIVSNVSKISKYHCLQCKTVDNLLTNFFPEAEKEYSKRNKTPFQELTYGANEETYWTCEKNHEWMQKPKNRFKIKKNYKTPCPQCEKEKNLVSKVFPELEEFYCKDNETPFSELTIGMHREIKTFCKEGHIRVLNVYNTVKYPNCPQCMQWGTSILEQEVVAYIKSILPKDVEIKENDRKLISPKELDIYIPELSVAVEFNGLYWHSEANGKSKNYHYNKWKQCKSKNVQLITVWEDDWLYRQEHVKSQLSTLLRTPYKQLSTHASKLSAKEVDKNKAKEFYNSSYLKEFSSDSNYCALVNNEKDSICALLTWKQADEKVVIIEDYCEKDSVVNGLEKLIHHILKRINNKNVENIIAHIDNSSVHGASFEKIGFMQVQSVKYNFSYVVKRERVHESHMSAAFFEGNQELVYDSDLTLEELKIKNGITKLWDCGKIRYVLNL